MRTRKAEVVRGTVAEVHLGAYIALTAVRFAVPLLLMFCGGCGARILIAVGVLAANLLCDARPAVLVRGLAGPSRHVEWTCNLIDGLGQHVPPHDQFHRAVQLKSPSSVE